MRMEMNGKATGALVALFALGLTAGLACSQTDTATAAENTGNESGNQGAGDAGAASRDVLGVPELTRTAPGMAKAFGDNYWYLPYAVTNEKMGLAFVEAYKKIVNKGEKPPRALEVPEGKGAGGGDKIYRLHEGVTDLFIQDINQPAATAVSQADIPVIVAQPRPGSTGASVLFMDGHVEFVKWGEFPVTRDFVNALKELDPPEYAEETPE